jgi:hypothetical protein
MRELEFLPSWYPTLRRKRRVLVIEAWLSLIIVFCLSSWLAVSAHNVITKESLLNVRQKQLTQSNIELQKLGELESLKKQMSDQAKLMARLGPNVPMSRLMDTFQQLLPKEMALRDVSVEYQKTFKAAAARSGAAGEPDPSYLVTIHGVAPSDMQLGNFMTNLAKAIPHWVGGSISDADAHQDGHLMRDFSFSFSIRLSDEDSSEQEAEIK